MKSKIEFYAISFFFLTTVYSCNPVKKASTLPASSSQLLMVLTDSVKAITGFMYCYERQNNKEWTISGERISVMVGRNGLGCGIGLHQASDLSSLPGKMEGDGKSPAGIFTLSRVFGYASADQMQGLKMPYIPVTEMTECIDDVKSSHYNQVVSREKSEPVDWDSSEKMHLAGVFYELGIVVDHNQNPVTKGCGSCIFLHNWSDPIVPTSGCTSMAPANLKHITFWLDKKKNPVIVQLTREAYADLRKKWRLPELPL
jgi:D-alanyl-D-alanine dipeptidase